MTQDGRIFVYEPEFKNCHSFESFDPGKVWLVLMMVLEAWKAGTAVLVQ
jgi:hypothetical protein